MIYNSIWILLYEPSCRNLGRCQVPNLSRVNWFCCVIWFLPCDMVAAMRPNRILLYHSMVCTYFFIKYRTCHSAIHFLIIHAIMKYFHTIIKFLLHTLIIINALGSMHILCNQYFPNSGPPFLQKEHFHALEKMGQKL